jgi:diadenosine tetraphosphate (Ap4A) HIT family hydrolase
MVFMDLNPVTPGHLLVVPRVHAVGLEDLDEVTGRHVWTIGHRMARALRRSGLRCEGINVFLADGEAAFQEVFHFHLHVFPRYAGDGFTIGANWAERSRDLLDAEAKAIKGAVV